jgi:hypothetical protein
VVDAHRAVDAGGAEDVALERGGGHRVHGTCVRPTLA